MADTVTFTSTIQVLPADRLKPLPDAQGLEFGRQFSDHWFHCRYIEGRGWTEAKVEKYGPISLDPAASVLHYGQALFEGMKAFLQPDGSLSLFRPDFNCQRFQAGAARLCLQGPPRELFMAGLRELLKLDARWALAEEGCSIYIRPTLIGTEAFLGVRPAKEILFYILLSPVRSYYTAKDRLLRIWVEDQELRAAPGGLGATKAGANYAASLHAALRAKGRGYDQVLWLDVERKGIEEVGTMNVFWGFKDEIVTPKLNDSILAGGMRDSVLHLLRHYPNEHCKKVNERRVTIDEVQERHKAGELVEAFGTGTAAVISPIAELGYKNEKIILNPDPGPISRWLAETIKGIQSGRRPDPFGWMVPLTDL
jgi:branched-chain amino acid aminotransferase